MMNRARIAHPPLDTDELTTSAAAVSSAAGARHLPPALLTDATWYGTLAAARDLAAHGVPVTLARDRFLAPARWSRDVSRTVRCPPVADAGRFLDWIHAFSARHPGHVYYPTSDDTAWLACVHRRSLEPNLRLFLPSLDALAQLLDKSQLARAARAVGLETPQTWAPRDDAEVDRLSRELPYPLFVKPRIQVLSAGAKGVLVLRREELVRVWRAWRQTSRVDPEVSRHLPDAALPIVQAHHSSSERIYTVDGFVGDGPDAFVTRACTKLLQLPRGSGAGIAFDAASVSPPVAAGLERLFRQVGYTGVFDVEFVIQDGRPLLIDVNPRFYNHMAFEVDRGMPLPWMTYLAALGDEHGLREALRSAQQVPAESRRVYAHRRSMKLLLAFQRLSGSMSAAEVHAWRRWMTDHAEEITDPASWEGDVRTELADALFMAQRLLRHPRSSMRDLLRAGSPAARMELPAEIPSKA